MAQNTAPSRAHFDEHYPVVLERAGLRDHGDQMQAEFEEGIRKIFNGYWAARERPTAKNIAHALERYQKGRAMMREAIQSLSAIHSEIGLATQLHGLPADELEEKIQRHLSLRGATDHLSREEWEGWDPEPALDLDAMISERDRGIEFLRSHPDVLASLLNREPGDYRKDIERALVVEPALDLLHAINFPKSRQLSRKIFFDALFDLLNMERQRRPTQTSINMVASSWRRKHKGTAEK